MPDVSLDVTSYARYAVEMGEGDDPEQIVGGELIVVATYVPDAIGAPGCELSGSTEQMDIDQDPINLLYDLQPGQVFPEPVYFDQVRVGKFNLPTFYAELTLAEDGTTPRLLLHHQAIWEWFTKALAAFQPGESTWQSTVTAPLLAMCHYLDPASVDSISERLTAFYGAATASIDIRSLDLDCDHATEDQWWVDLLCGYGTVTRARVLERFFISDGTFRNYATRHGFKPTRRPSGTNVYDAADIRQKLMIPILEGRQCHDLRDRVRDTCDRLSIMPLDIAALI